MLKRTAVWGVCLAPLGASVVVISLFPTRGAGARSPQSASRSRVRCGTGTANTGAQLSKDRETEECATWMRPSPSSNASLLET